MQDRISILLATDLSKENLCSDPQVLSFIQKEHADVTLVHAIEYIPYYPYYPYNEEKFISDCHKSLENKLSKVDDFLKENNVAVKGHIIKQGKACKVICDTANEIEADFILAGAGETFIFDGLIGSTAEKISRIAKQPVLIFKTQSRAELKHICCAYDFSESSAKALKEAVLLAQTFEAQLDIVHVVDKKHSQTDGTVESAEKMLKIRCAEYDLPESAKTVVLSGQKPEDSLNSYAKGEEIDLIITGSNGHSAISRFFLGSTTANLLKTAPCSVMVTKVKQ